MHNIPGAWYDIDAAAKDSNGMFRLAFPKGGSSGAIRRGKAKFSALDFLIDRFVACPWPATAGLNIQIEMSQPRARRPLYTVEERRRRDATPWTMVQGFLAPIQFAVFLVSAVLVLNYLSTGRGYELATASVIVKTAILYTIMLTGSIWEKKVFDKYLLAPSFFWEDIVSMLVLALHTAYLVALIAGWGSARRMVLALAGTRPARSMRTQFVLKLRAARLEATPADSRR